MSLRRFLYHRHRDGVARTGENARSQENPAFEVCSNAGFSVGVKRIRAALVILGAVACAGCGTRGEQVAAPGGADGGGSRPNVLLIEVCSLRYDHLGCAGYDRPTSPAIDALAERGTFFTRCISASSWTKPSTTSILTGLYPGAHQLTDYYKRDQIMGDDFGPKRSLSPKVVTLAEHLKSAGYQTGAFVANVHAWPVFGLDQGFDHFDHQDPLDGRSIIGRFNKWIGSLDGTKPFFSFVLFKDVHHPYWPGYARYTRFTRDASPVQRDGYREYAQSLNALFLPHPEDPSAVTDEHVRKWIDLYDAQVSLADECISRLMSVLEQSEVAENTSIWIVSDHGDHHFEHQEANHGTTLYQELVHVPLVVTLPGTDQRQRVDRVVSTVDILPTIAEVCGIPLSYEAHGESLMPLLRGEARPLGRRYAFSSVHDQRAIQDARYKLLRRPRRADVLFDLVEDPKESTDISGTHQEILARLAGALDETLAEEEKLRQQLGSAGRRQLDPDAVKQLKDLGYLGQ